MKDSKVNMLLIGAGVIGKVHVDSARGLNNIKYVGVVDIDKDKADKFARQYNIKGYTSVTEAIDELQPDAVDICTPTPYHLPVIEQCADKVKNILCEKPITLDHASAMEVEEIVEKEKVKLMVSQILRFFPEYIYATETTRKKTYGKLQSVGCKRLSPPLTSNSWMLNDKTGGGAVIDLQVHDMDFVLQICGKPQAIMAHGIESKGGINTVYNNLYYLDDINVTVESCFVMPPSYPFRMYYQIVYDKAVIDFDFWRPAGEQVRVFPEGGQEFCPELVPQEVYRVEISYFAQQIINNKEFDRVPLNESIYALQMCLASRQSCLNKEKVSCYL